MYSDRADLIFIKDELDKEDNAPNSYRALHSHRTITTIHQKANNELIRG